MAAGTARRRTASSSLTSMRSAWKVRLAGWPPVRRAGAGISAYSSSTRGAEVVNGVCSRRRTTARGDLARELLLAVLAQDAGQLLGLVGVEHVGGRRALGAVHAHVEGRVLGVGEAALAHVELHRGDTEVEQDGVDGAEAELVEHLGELVVDGVDAGEPVAEAGEPLAGQVEGGGVAVDADDPGQRAAGQHGLGVPAEAEGGIDHDGALVLQGGREEGHDPVQEDGDVCGAGHVSLAGRWR